MDAYITCLPPHDSTHIALQLARLQATAFAQIRTPNDVQLPDAVRLLQRTRIVQQRRHRAHAVQKLAAVLRLQHVLGLEHGLTVGQSVERLSGVRLGRLQFDALQANRAGCDVLDLRFEVDFVGVGIVEFRFDIERLEDVEFEELAERLLDVIWGGVLDFADQTVCNVGYLCYYGTGKSDE